MFHNVLLLFFSDHFKVLLWHLTLVLLLYFTAFLFSGPSKWSSEVPQSANYVILLILPVFLHTHTHTHIYLSEKELTQFTVDALFFTLHLFVHLSETFGRIFKKKKNSSRSFFFYTWTVSLLQLSLLSHSDLSLNEGI